jgi:hypothetical protein
VLVPVADHGVEHETCPEATRGVDGAVIAAIFFVLAGLHFFFGPDFFDPAVFAGLFVGDTVAVFAGEGEFGGVAFNVGCATR